MDKASFLNIIHSTPLVSIDLILEDQQGRILLGKRNNRPAKGYWFVPGGRIRKNEKLSEAMERISVAELGHILSLNDAELLGAYDHIYQDNFHGAEEINTHYVALGFKVKVGEAFEFDTDDQHSEMRWWSQPQLLNSSEVHDNTKAYLRS